MACTPEEPKFGRIIDKTYDDPDDEFKVKQVPIQRCTPQGDVYQWCGSEYEFRYILVRDEAHYNLTVEGPDGKQGKVEVSEEQWNSHKVGDCWIKCR